jgi:hypothetical protein
MTVKTLLAALLPRIDEHFAGRDEPDRAQIRDGVQTIVTEAFANRAQVGQVKEAPAREDCFRRIFENFRDATVALLECDDKPKGVRDAVCEMLDLFNNELGGAAESDSENARRVMTRVFDLNDGDKETDEAVEGLTSAKVTLDVARAFDVIDRYSKLLPESITAPLDEAIGAFNEAEDVEAHEEAARAAHELAGAFAAIEQWRDYMPVSAYNSIAGALSDWVITGNHFLNNPASIRTGLSGIFREIFKLDEEEDAA